MRAVAQQRHHFGKGQLLVVVVAAQPLSRVAEDVVTAIRLLRPLRADPHERAVGGAAADIDNQHPLLTVQPGFVFQCRGDRFVLKHEVAETGARRGVGQHGNRLLVGTLLVQPLEVDGATDHHLLDVVIQKGRRTLAYVGHHGSDDSDEPLLHFVVQPRRA